MTNTTTHRHRVHTTRTAQATQVWHGIEVGSAAEVSRILSCDDDECEHRVIHEDGTDAPVWGEIPADVAVWLLREYTVWSWDEDGVAIGGDDLGHRFATWDALRAAHAAGRGL